MNRTVGALMILLATAGHALAVLDPGVPEIDPSSGVAALALLSGGLVILRARVKK